MTSRRIIFIELLKYSFQLHKSCYFMTLSKQEVIWFINIPVISQWHISYSWFMNGMCLVKINSTITHAISSSSSSSMHGNTGKDQNGQEWTGIDWNGRMEIPEWTYGNTAMDRNGLEWTMEIPEWTYFKAWKYRNGPVFIQSFNIEFTIDFQ